jgi:hypothetical protein
MRWIKLLVESPEVSGRYSTEPITEHHVALSNSKETLIRLIARGQPGILAGSKARRVEVLLLSRNMKRTPTTNANIAGKKRPSHQ